MNTLVAENSDSFGLLNAIFIAMSQSEDRLQSQNPILTKLITLCTQLLHKRLQMQKTVDMSYQESIRLPAQYYNYKHNSSPITPRKRRLTSTPDITPEKEKASRKRQSSLTRGTSVEGDTPVLLRNMSPILSSEQKRKQQEAERDKRQKVNVEWCVCLERGVGFDC